MYIIHPTVTKSGEYGLGNQLFQIASSIGIAKDHNADFRVIGEWHNNKYFQNKLPSFVGDLKEPVVVKENSFDYYPVVLPANKPLIYLEGYFQSPKYFKEAEKEVRKAFEFKEEHIAPVKQYLDSANLGNTCSISVRRGDYVRLQHIHPLQPDSYWVNAQNIIEKNKTIDTYVIFSDDIQWCRQNVHLFKATGKKVVFFQGRTQIDDFIAITLCKHNIITNSTFSWWGAWLNKNTDKLVVMPKLWFGPVGPWSGPSEGADLRCQNWYIIS